MTVRKKVAILISGGGSNMVTLAKSLQGSDLAEVCVVVSNRPDASGLAKAQALGIATEVVDHKAYGSRAEFEAALLKILQGYTPDVVALAGFMRVLGADFIAPFAGRMLNIHPSLLPKYKGLNTHARAIEAGDRTAGCSIHLVTPELDDGPVLGQAVVEISQGETPDSLAEKVLVQEHRLYPAVLARFLQGNKDLLTLG